MRTAIICVFAFIALASGQDGESQFQANNGIKPKLCVPGSTKMLDCNTCFCNQDGSAWGCTLMGCAGIVANPFHRVRREEIDVQSNAETESQICEPGSTKMIDCNSCFCAGKDIGWACTKMGCHNIGIINPDSTITQPTEGAP